MHKSNIGATVGGVVGGLAALGLAVLAVILFRRRRSRRIFVDNAQDPNPVIFTQTEPFRYSSIQIQRTTDTPMESTAPVQASSPPIPSPTSRKSRRLQAHHDTILGNVPVNRSSPSGSLPTGPSLSNNLPSGHDPVISEVRGLRSEMEGLRRAVQQIGVDNNEPPPTYSE